MIQYAGGHLHVSGKANPQLQLLRLTSLHFDGLKPVLLSLRLKVVAELVLFFF